MTRPIEEVIAEARDRLEKTGRLNVAAFVAAYPEHADELRATLPAMLTLHEEKRWHRLQEETRAYAANLFTQLSPQAAAAAPRAAAAAPAAAPAVEETLGDLLRREREGLGRSLDEQAKVAGIPPQSLAELEKDKTPVTGLDNLTLKSIATRAATPFGALLKEVRRLLSLESLQMGQAAPMFTRDKDLTEASERDALLNRVLQGRPANPAMPEAAVLEEGGEPAGEGEPPSGPPKAKP